MAGSHRQTLVSHFGIRITIKIRGGPEGILIFLLQRPGKSRGRGRRRGRRRGRSVRPSFKHAPSRCRGLLVRVCQGVRLPCLGTRAMQPLVPVMTPAPGERLRRFVGDSIQFRLKDRDGRRVEKGWRALLRTNLGRAEVVDFKAKGYLVDARGWQHWPEGPDMGLSVHPDSCRTANIVYCAFTRLFGPGKAGRSARGEKLEPVLTALDEDGYTVVPPSGKLRDVTAQLPHIFGTLGCRILHLLPVNPVPTTYARFGRFGSPYAALDLAAIDPALVVFDQRTTGLDQFRELTYAAHLRGVRVFLDIVINHTGWGSVLQEKHPEWFVRQPEGRFASPCG